MFLVLIAQMNPRLLKAVLVDQTFITGRSEKLFGIFSLTQVLSDFPVREVLLGHATGTQEFYGSKEMPSL